MLASEEKIFPGCFFFFLLFFLFLIFLSCCSGKVLVIFSLGLIHFEGERNAGRSRERPRWPPTLRKKRALGIRFLDREKLQLHNERTHVLSENCNEEASLPVTPTSAGPRAEVGPNERTNERTNGLRGRFSRSFSGGGQDSSSCIAGPDPNLFELASEARELARDRIFRGLVSHVRMSSKHGVSAQ